MPKFLLKLLLAALAGFLYSLAFPNSSFWLLALTAVAIFVLTLEKLKLWQGFLVGLSFGAAFWMPLINWLTLYLGPIPWLALATLMVLWFAVAAALYILVANQITQTGVSDALKILFKTLFFASVWVLRESVQSTFPYGGFAWGRIAHTQVDAPLMNIVAWLGFSGFGFLLVFIAAGIALVLAGNIPGPKKLLSAIGIIAVFLILMLPGVPQLDEEGTLNVVAIQGNSKSGVFDDRESGSVIADHIAVTEAWLKQHDAQADVVVWPENSAEFNLLKNPVNLSHVLELSEEAGAPFVVGSIVRDGTPEHPIYTNSSLIIDPNSSEISRYDKRHPVPFAEYMPQRAFYRAIVPELVDLVQLEYAHGTTASVMNLQGIRAGIAICFDIIFDVHASRMNAEQASVIFAQTNNADFGQTAQSAQQLAIAKLRAVEMGRSVVNISTVATSEIVTGSGEVLASIEPWTAGYMQAEVPVFSGSTPAMNYGANILFAINGFALLAVAWALSRFVFRPGARSRYDLIVSD